MIKKRKFYTHKVEYFRRIIRFAKLEVDHVHTVSLKQALPPTKNWNCASFKDSVASSDICRQFRTQNRIAAYVTQEEHSRKLYS